MKSDEFKQYKKMLKNLVGLLSLQINLQYKKENCEKEFKGVSKLTPKDHQKELTKVKESVLKVFDDEMEEHRKMIKDHEKELDVAFEKLNPKEKLKVSCNGTPHHKY